MNRRIPFITKLISIGGGNNNDELPFLATSEVIHCLGRYHNLPADPTTKMKKLTSESENIFPPIRSYK